MEGFIALVALAAFFAILYAVSYFPAKWMVKKRTLLAKKSLIGQETPEKIELMKKVAAEALTKNTIYLELLEKEQCTVSTTVQYGEISMVKVENERVKILAWSNGNERVSHKAFSEKGGTLVTAGYLAMLLFIIFGFYVLFTML